MGTRNFTYTVELTLPGDIQGGFTQLLGAVEGLGTGRVGNSKTLKGSSAPGRPDKEHARETHTSGV